MKRMFYVQNMCCKSEDNAKEFQGLIKLIGTLLGRC